MGQNETYLFHKLSPKSARGRGKFFQIFSNVCSIIPKKYVKFFLDLAFLRKNLTYLFCQMFFFFQKKVFGIFSKGQTDLRKTDFLMKV